MSDGAPVPQRMRFDLRVHGTRPALIEASGLVHSYLDLDAMVDALAEQLGPRELVLCLTRSTLGGVVGYLGAVRCGAVPLLMDHETPLPALLQLVASYAPDHVWAPAELAGAFPGYRSHYGAHDYCLLGADRAAEPLAHPDLALLLTTSGSTGSAKLVRISSQNLAANSASIVSYLGLGPDDRTITTLPFNYSFGLSILNTYLSAGGSLVLSEGTLFQREFWEALRTQRVTSLSGVPYTFEMLKKVRFLKMDLPALHTMTQAGGKLPLALCQEFALAAEAKGTRFFTMYGATEATARMAYLPAARAVEKAGSIGVAIPGGTLELRGEQGVQVSGASTVGELVYRGPNVSLGYAESRADLAKGDELHGVLATGDLAQRDDDGFYYVVGRTKRFIKLFGVRTNLDEVERLVAHRFPGLSLACTGEDNQLRVHVEDADSCDAVHDHLARSLRVTPSAITVRYLARLPRSPSGKLRYGEL